MELLGWNVLRVARSEIGSNRKHRSNRFLTVVQYAIDMWQALLEMHRILRPDGRVVIIVGRESNVRGVSFQNGRIVSALAVGGAGFRFDQRQERKFKTKFGETIYEDILHFVPIGVEPAISDNWARRLGQYILNEAMSRAANDVRADMLAAIHQASAIQASPLFRVSNDCGGDA